MKLHSDTITDLHLRSAVGYAEEMLPEYGTIWIEENNQTGSRRRKHALVFRLEGDGTLSKRKVNTGRRGGGDEFAATYDQWGWTLAFLFDIDPLASVSTGVAYDGYDDYHRQTKGKYLLTDLTSRAVLLTRWEHLREAGVKFREPNFYMPQVPMRILREEGY